MTKTKLRELAETVSSNAMNGNWGDALTLLKGLNGIQAIYVMHLIRWEGLLKMEYIMILERICGRHLND